MPEKLFSEMRLPPELARIAQETAVQINPANGEGLELAGMRGMCWLKGGELQVSFLGGFAEVHQKVKFYADQWSRYANIRFIFNQDPSAQIRISLQEGFSQSYIGVEALYAPAGEATMNLDLTLSDSDDEFSRTVLHEFGHALGLIHEHQSPASGIQWNHEAVIAELTSSRYNWTREKVQKNIFERLAISQTQFNTGFDPLSIMVYPIPARWTVDGFSADHNKTLSVVDKQFISVLYPW